MSIPVAVIIVALRILGVLTAVILFALIAILLLPLSVKGTGFCQVESNLEEALDSLDGCESEPGDIDLLLFDYGFELDLKVFLGQFSIWVSESDAPCLKLFGIKLPFALGGKKAGKGKVRGESGKAQEEPKVEEPKVEETKGAGKSKNPEKPNRPEKSKKHKKVSLREIKKFTAPQVRSKVVWVVKGLLRAAHLETDLDLELGFPDPSHTGIVYGLFSAYAGAFGVKGVRIHPNFQSQLISAGGKASAWVMPGQIAWIVARFAFDKEIRRFWWKKNKQRNQSNHSKQDKRPDSTYDEK